MLKRIYEPQAYLESTGLQSYWSETAERSSFESLEEEVATDVVVVGAGYTGLNASLQLTRQHQRSVVVLDAQWPGWGASGRNGGFCCAGGGKLPHAQVLKKWGESGAQSFADTQRLAIEHVRELLEAEGIDASVSGSGELCLAHSQRAANGFSAEAELISKLHGVQAEHWSAEQVRERGAVVEGGGEGLFNPLGFALNPWQYVQGLAQRCVQSGVKIYGKSTALSVQPEGGGWRVTTAKGSVKAAKLVIATNGYSSDNLPAWMAGRYLPALSSIVITRPLTESEVQAQGFSTDIMSYDSRTLLHYFRRLSDGRFLFGSRGGLKASEAGEHQVRQGAEQDFKRMFPAWAGVELTHFWSGLVCLSGGLQPYVGPVPECPNAYAAFGWHGNGVSTASYSGKLLADIVAGVSPAESICVPMRTVPHRMPLGRFRRALLRPAYAAAQLTDRFL